MQNFCSKCGSKLVEKSTICSECQTPVPFVNELLNKHKVEEVKNKIFGFSQKLQFGSKKLSETITKYAQTASDSLQKKPPEDIIKKTEELKVEFENGEVQVGEISNLSSILQSNEVKKICFNFINTYFNYNNSIDFKIVNVTYKEYLFDEFNSSVDVHYTYQSGYENTDAFNQANLEYERDYRQYQMAINQIEAAYANAYAEADKAIQQGRTPLRKPRLIEPDKPRKPIQEDYMLWGDYVDGHIVKKDVKIVTEGKFDVLYLSSKVQDILNFDVNAAYCNYEYLRRNIKDHKAIPIMNYSTPDIVTELRAQSETVIDFQVDAAIDEGIGEYYNRDKKATSIKKDITFRFFCLPLWTVTVEYKNKPYLFYIDEINGLIDGDEIKENVVFAFFNNLMSEKSKPEKSDQLSVNFQDSVLEEKYLRLRTERLKNIDGLFASHTFKEIL